MAWYADARRSWASGRLDPLVVVLIWITACWPWLVGHRFVTGDSIGAFYPTAKFVMTSFLRGDPPWWNPLSFGGQPLLGDPQSMIFTPHVLAGIITGGHYGLHAFDVTTLLCPLAGSLAVHRLARRFTCSRMMPIIGAAVFMIGGPATGRLQHVPEILAYSLLPIQLLAADALCRRPNVIRSTLLSAAILVSLLNPNQVVFVSPLALLPFAIILWLRSRQRIRVALHAAGAAAAAVILAAPVLSCIVETVALSNRPALDLSASVPFSFPFYNLSGLFLPGLYGLLHPGTAIWAPTDPSEDYIYIGVIPTFLLCVTIAQPRRVTWLCSVGAALAAFWMIYTLGTHTPLYPFMFAHVPGLSGFRRPADGGFLMNFSIAVSLAAQRDLPPLKEWLLTRRTVAIAMAACLTACFIAAVFALATAAAKSGHSTDLNAVFRQFAFRLVLLSAVAALAIINPALRSRALMPCVIILVVADMMSAGRFNPILDASYAVSPTAKLYKNGGTTTRKAASTTAIVNFLTENGISAEAHVARAEVLGGTLAGNLGLTRGLTLLDGYNPLNMATFARAFGTEFLQASPKQFTAVAPDYDSDIYRRLGLRYILIPTDDLLGSAVATPFGRANSALRAQLAASAVSKEVGIVGEYEVWERSNWIAKASLVPEGADVGDTCSVTKYRNAAVRISCAAQQPRTLVIGDPDAPGWFACVNGVATPIKQYEGFFRSLVIPKGNSDIRLGYQPIPWLRHEGC